MWRSRWPFSFRWVKRSVLYLLVGQWPEDAIVNWLTGSLRELECGDRDSADIIDKVQPTMLFDATKKLWVDPAVEVWTNTRIIGRIQRIDGIDIEHGSSDHRYFSTSISGLFPNIFFLPAPHLLSLPLETRAVISIAPNLLYSMRCVV